MDLIPDPEKLVRRRKNRPPVEAREEVALPPDMVPDLDDLRSSGSSRSSRLTVREREEFQSLLHEIHGRSQEALKIFRPMPEQERFFQSDAPERLVLGGNRGGKTVTSMVEVARAFTGQDPYDKYPKENGVFILVAKDQKKNARVFYRTLFKPGAFRIVRDPETKLWRPYLPEDDWKLESEVRPAPPLIPSRFLKGPISFGNVRDEEPKVARGKNGWELWFYSSRGEMPQGVAVDGVCFDEELEREAWYGEMMVRLVDKRQFDRATGRTRGGKFIWSATPQSGTPLLYDLYSRAVDEEAAREEQLMRGGVPVPPSIEAFNLSIGENPFLAEQSKDVLKNQYEDRQEEYDVRILGKFALFGSRIYPEFEPRGIHGCEAFQIPDDWSRYLFVDPGRQVCAALFVAVPPPAHPWRGRKVIYDEIYLRFCNAAMFAEALVKKAGLDRIERGFIDHRAGRMTEVGSGFTIEYQYMQAMKSRGFSFQSGGVGFTWAADDVKSGISAVQGMMHIVEGRSELVVFYEKCPKLLWEMERYSYKRQPNGIVVSDEPIKRHDHACDCLRYLAMSNIKYVRPRKREKVENYALKALERKRERQKHAKISDGTWNSAIKLW